MKVTRRDAIGVLATAVSTAAMEQQAAAQTAVSGGSAPLQWLGGNAPPVPTGVSWGVPWPRGAVRREQAFALDGPAGQALPLQSWPMAYWPDGSIKFTGHAAVPGAVSGPFRLAPGVSPPPSPPVIVTDTPAAVEIDNGRFRARIAKSGANFLEEIRVDDRTAVRHGRLVCTLEGGAAFTSAVRRVTVERTGPVRAAVKVEGVHKADSGSREWLPFTVRLYFYAGADPVRIVHTVIFDGDDQKDFIRGLGLAFSVPLREEIHNRHIRFSGEGDGLWSEPVQPLTGRRPLVAPGRAGSIYADQLAGKRIPNKETFNAAGQKLLSDWASWDAFKLVQPNPDGFTILKRTNPQSCWLDVSAGKRSSGLVFAGDVSGGMALSVKNFWQSYPASLEVQRATAGEAAVYAWLWSPDAPPMDLRHYDTRAHDLDSSYEDVQPGFSTPHGVARTSELTLFPSPGVPAKQETAQHARIGQEPPLLVTTPGHIHSAGVFGIWSLPDRSTPAKRALEDQLDAAFDLYHKEVEQRRWYGFWNFGDVMHQHDGPRRQWRYDIGGYAWDNTELGTDLWLWYSFLRTGRPEIFRMAEAMSRHTSEVDCYHLGRFATLGSRHNVRHWGCGAKEPRISQAAYRRIFYYLTTDERTGDLMREVLDSDRKTVEIDPMRLASPLTAPLPYPGRVRGGPDWLAFVSNWMTEWERTGDVRWRDKIVAGFDSISKMPFGFMTGPNQLWGYDPQTGNLHAIENRVGVYNLTVIMGGAEVVFELNTLIDHAGWKKAWEQYCRLTNAPPNVVAADMAAGTEGADGRYASPGRLSGYLYMQTKNPAFAKRAWDGVTGGPNRARAGRYTPAAFKGPEVLAPIEEVSGLSTNSVAQQGLQLIQVLEMAGEYTPE